MKAKAVRGHEEIQIYDGKSKVLTDGTLPLRFEEFTIPETTSLQVDFITPTHIKSEGKVLHHVPEFTFYNLLKAIFNRLSTLSYFYGEEKFGWDYEALLERAKGVEIVEEKSHLNWMETIRYSRRRKREDLLAGVTGKMTYLGPNLGDFLPYLKLGEHTHVGNRTTFGLGGFVVIER